MWKKLNLQTFRNKSLTFKKCKIDVYFSLNSERIILLICYAEEKNNFDILTVKMLILDCKQ